MPNYVSASLYVGDLANDVTEGLLFEVFNTVGPVVSIRVCRDAVTRRSLGYAYVNFHSVVDAERALDTMNNHGIKGRPCRIMWSQRDPSIRKSGVGNIFIKNLDKSIDHQALHDTFQTYGNILSCKVALDESGQSLGYGFVHYDNPESADKAIQTVNGMNIKGNKVYVGPFIPRKERIRAMGGEKKFTNVYVKNLPDHFDKDVLNDLFGKFGKITNSCVNKIEEGKVFGFVNFEDADNAKEAVEAMNTSELEGKKLYVGRAQKKAEREQELRQKVDQWKMERMTKYQGVNLYVKNLEDTVDDERLRSEFASFGQITSAKVMTDKGNSRGFGFVCFSSPEEATRAVTEMNGRMLGAKPLYVALAQRKEVRRAQLEAQHAQRSKGVRGNANHMPMGYPAGPPVFFSQGMPQQNFVYPPQQMMPRRGWTPPNQYQMPNYVVPPMGGRQQPGRGRQQVKGQAGQRGRTPQQPQASPTPAPAQGANRESESAQQLAGYTADQQKQMLGERLYPLVKEQQPELAGKITGMLLDSHYMDEIFHFLENTEALTSQITEAVRVLEDHVSAAKPEAAPAAETPEEETTA